MKQVPLTQGKFALVDAEDYEWLMQWDWFYTRGYAVRTDRSGPAQRTIRMHRLILSEKLKTGMVCDHINRNGLDNRRDNLRACWQSENRHNSAKCKKKTTSAYLGVTKCKSNWRACLKSGGIKRLDSVFSSEIDAALAYNRAIALSELPFANKNGIIDDGRTLTALDHAIGASGIKGVRRNGNHWQASISIQGKRKYLGTFDTIEEAADAYNLAKKNKLDKYPPSKFIIKSFGTSDSDGAFTKL